ncbi:unnamed protein product [Ranitomeya imitator]|uniref:Uncharacterized protein n=1 Tax=Ranitomeya imitator TaxID=111125 RepID=A0ABN9LUM9_9NEOB|nr:unnamed protein product [Ranitomeya imitator]
MGAALQQLRDSLLCPLTPTTRLVLAGGGVLVFAILVLVLRVTLHNPGSSIQSLQYRFIILPQSDQNDGDCFIYNTDHGFVQMECLTPRWFICLQT